MQGLTIDRWREGIQFELDFWEDWIRTRGSQWQAEFEERVSPDTPLDPSLAALVADQPSPIVRILDVGAGPLTAVGKKLAGKTLEITAVDALANEYDVFLDRYRVVPLIRTAYLPAEDVAGHFAPGSFDLAFSRNALDHTRDPFAAIEGMLTVLRPGGWLVLWHFENEGRAAQYVGFHQWNFQGVDGRFLIESRDGEVTDVGAALDHLAPFTCWKHGPFITVHAQRRCE